MVTTQHYVWAGGHFILLISAITYLFSWALFRQPSVWWYKTSYTGAIVSYAIVCQKSLGAPQPTATWVTRALADENVQYFILAFVWWTSKPVAVSLLPYLIFSDLLALTFTRTTLMSQLLPQGPPTAAGGAPTPHPLAKKLQVWVKSNYDTAMKIVAYTELAILFRVVVGVFIFWNSIILPIIYAHFIRMRYSQSAFTKEAVHRAAYALDERINTPEMSPAVKNAWATVQSLIGRWAGATLPARPVPAGGARPAAR